MIKKIKKLLKVSSIDLLVYSMKKSTKFNVDVQNYSIQFQKIDENKSRYFIRIEDNVVHESFAYRKLFIQKLIRTKGPTIGDCKTIDAFKGKSIYPYVINYIANQELEKGAKEVFINVSPSNISSIKGIEKAGFKPFLHVKAKRFLFFYFKTEFTSF